MHKKIIAFFLLLLFNNYVFASGYWTYDYSSNTYVKVEDNSNDTRTANLTPAFNSGIKKYEFPETEYYVEKNTYNNTVNIEHQNVVNSNSESENTTFYEKHPILTGIGIGALLIGSIALSAFIEAGIDEINDNRHNDYKHRHHRHR